MALCARSQAELDEAATAIHHDAQGLIDILALRCDVTSDEDVARFAAQVESRLGVPHVLVNNAGAVAPGRLDEQDPSLWRAMIEVNLFGTYRLTRAFLPMMRYARRGRIVNVASIAGRVGTPLLTSYCAAKHAVVGLTRALAEELRQDGIQVNAICPSTVETRMAAETGFEPAMSVDEVAKIALFLAADAPDALTGACLDVTG